MRDELEPVQDRGVDLPDEHALHRMLDSGRDGYWALVTVHVEQPAELDGERAGTVLRTLVGRLGEILNSEATVYRTRDGLAVLAGPGDDLYELRHGMRLLKKAVVRAVTEPEPAHTGVPPLSFSFKAAADELSRLRPGGAAARRRGPAKV
ncbi:hypothetical protein GCM10022214_39930 [Actinomadura miaoliensis]|uniref:GGDEF domain-containing protein n=1 Tax=Actinomadura miaoliensis TaxID=430685 RepID=A0ABP7VZX2_9ACTN